MYENRSCFDPNTTLESLSENGFSQTMPNCNPKNLSMEDAAMDVELQRQLGLAMEHCCNTINNNLSDTHFMQGMSSDLNKISPYDECNWDYEMSYLTQNPNAQEGNLQDIHDMQNGHHPNYRISSLPNFLNPLNLTRCSSSSSGFPNSSFPFVPQCPNSASNAVHDPSFPLNLSPQGPLLSDFFQTQPHGSLFGVVDEREVGGGVYENGERRKIDRGKGPVKAKEKIRREQQNSLYEALRGLLPNPAKNDKASVLGDAIEYIKELHRTVNELKIAVEEKRCGRERNKRQKTEKEGIENSNMKADADESYYYNNNNGPSSSLRSSWLQRKSKETEVDVRIIDDEVTVKLAQRKKINCLLIVSKVLDELQLDIHHVAGGLVGDNFSFLFNTKICEGSCVYASGIANKLIEVVDRQYAAIPPANTY